MLIYIISPHWQTTNIHINLRRILDEGWLTIPGQDKIKQRAIDILDEWEQLLNNLDNYCWARVASPSPPRPCDFLSLVYVPKDKRHGECAIFQSTGKPHILFQIALRMASNSDALSIVYAGLKLERPFEETLWHRSYEAERMTP